MPDLPWIKLVPITTVDGVTSDVAVTDTDGFLAAYATDDNTFWACDPGHIRNVLDAMIDYAQRLRTELARHGWGDFHYARIHDSQEPRIVALLAEYPALGPPEHT